MTFSTNFARFVAVFAVLSPMFTFNTANAQTSYPMTCRGGGTLSIQNDGGNGVRINFQAGRGAAPQGLSPGECTWSDRALRSGEPTTICDRASSAAQYVSRLVQSNEYSIFQVYNDGRGCMRVTRVGP
ncbi:hypothetical protein [Nostoc sp. CMAA1605]|uniref:hypothetical protein n=1 Tax=Nostoc sp. CMAA1605 TaxID=2055159 RepID=UPI001F1E09EB|nr:hypothetical protein [Nostoc sp. CMAA1605]MCF4967997.1 hypothetical protein [Nostoc sp. CMAA1605]